MSQNGNSTLYRLNPTVEMLVKDGEVKVFIDWAGSFEHERWDPDRERWVLCSISESRLALRALSLDIPQQIHVGRLD